MNASRWRLFASFIVILVGIGLWYRSQYNTTVDRAPSSIPPAESPAPVLAEKSKIVLEILFEEDAQPYIFGANPESHLWKITQRHLQGLVGDRTVSVPLQLSEMHEIPIQANGTWTDEQLLATAKKFSSLEVEPSTLKITVLFVSGFHDANGSANTSVLSRNVRGTTLIAMFKDVIRATARQRSGELVAKYVEQTTNNQQLAHALQLENQPESGGHCSHANCILHGRFERGAHLVALVKRLFALGTSATLFGDECAHSNH